MPCRKQQAHRPTKVARTPVAYLELPLGLRVRSELIPTTLVRNRVFVSARIVRLMPRPIPRRSAKADHRRPLPEPSLGRQWRIREVAEVLGGHESKILRLIASGRLPARKAIIAAGGFCPRLMTVIDDADVRAMYRSFGEK